MALLADGLPLEDAVASIRLVGTPEQNKNWTRLVTVAMAKTFANKIQKDGRGNTFDSEESDSALFGHLYRLGDDVPGEDLGPDLDSAIGCIPTSSIKVVIEIFQLLEHNVKRFLDVKPEESRRVWSLFSKASLDFARNNPNFVKAIFDDIDAMSTRIVCRIFGIGEKWDGVLDLKSAGQDAQHFVTLHDADRNVHPSDQPKFDLFLLAVLRTITGDTEDFIKVAQRALLNRTSIFQPFRAQANLLHRFRHLMPSDVHSLLRQVVSHRRQVTENWFAKSFDQGVGLRLESLTVSEKRRRTRQYARSLTSWCVPSKPKTDEKARFPELGFIDAFASEPLFAYSFDEDQFDFFSPLLMIASVGHQDGEGTAPWFSYHVIDRRSMSISFRRAEDKTFWMDVRINLDGILGDSDSDFVHIPDIGVMPGQSLRFKIGSEIVGRTRRDFTFHKSMSKSEHSLDAVIDLVNDTPYDCKRKHASYPSESGLKPFFPDFECADPIAFHCRDAVPRDNRNQPIFKEHCEKYFKEDRGRGAEKFAVVSIPLSSDVGLSGRHDEGAIQVETRGPGLLVRSVWSSMLAMFGYHLRTSKKFATSFLWPKVTTDVLKTFAREVLFDYAWRAHIQPGRVTWRGLTSGQSSSKANITHLLVPPIGVEGDEWMLFVLDGFRSQTVMCFLEEEHPSDELVWVGDSDEFLRQQVFRSRLECLSGAFFQTITKDGLFPGMTSQWRFMVEQYIPNAEKQVMTDDEYFMPSKFQLFMPSVDDDVLTMETKLDDHQEAFNTRSVSCVVDFKAAMFANTHYGSQSNCARYHLRRVETCLNLLNKIRRRTGVFENILESAGDAGITTNIARLSAEQKTKQYFMLIFRFIIHQANNSSESSSTRAEKTILQLERDRMIGVLAQRLSRCAEHHTSFDFNKACEFFVANVVAPTCEDYEERRKLIQERVAKAEEEEKERVPKKPEDFLTDENLLKVRDIAEIYGRVSEKFGQIQRNIFDKIASVDEGIKKMHAFTGSLLHIIGTIVTTESAFFASPAIKEKLRITEDQGKKLSGMMLVEQELVRLHVSSYTRQYSVDALVQEFNEVINFIVHFGNSIREEFSKKDLNINALHVKVADFEHQHENYLSKDNGFYAKLSNFIGEFGFKRRYNIMRSCCVLLSGYFEGVLKTANASLSGFIKGEPCTLGITALFGGVKLSPEVSVDALYSYKYHLSTLRDNLLSAFRRIQETKTHFPASKPGKEWITPDVEFSFPAVNCFLETSEAAFHDLQSSFLNAFNSFQGLALAHFRTTTAASTTSMLQSRVFASTDDFKQQKTRKRLLDLLFIFFKHLETRVINVMGTSYSLPAKLDGRLLMAHRSECECEKCKQGDKTWIINTELAESKKISLPSNPLSGPGDLPLYRFDWEKNRYGHSDLIMDKYRSLQNGLAELYRMRMNVENLFHMQAALDNLVGNLMDFAVYISSAESLALRDGSKDSASLVEGFVENVIRYRRRFSDLKSSSYIKIIVFHGYHLKDLIDQFRYMQVLTEDSTSVFTGLLAQRKAEIANSMKDDSRDFLRTESINEILREFMSRDSINTKESIEKRHKLIQNLIDVAKADCLEFQNIIIQDIDVPGTVKNLQAVFHYLMAFFRTIHGVLRRESEHNVESGVPMRVYASFTTIMTELASFNEFLCCNILHGFNVDVEFNPELAYSPSTMFTLSHDTQAVFYAVNHSFQELFYIVKLFVLAENSKVRTKEVWSDAVKTLVSQLGKHEFVVLSIPVKEGGEDKTPWRIAECLRGKLNSAGKPFVPSDFRGPLHGVDRTGHPSVAHYFGKSPEEIEREAQAKLQEEEERRRIADIEEQKARERAELDRVTREAGSLGESGDWEGMMKRLPDAVPPRASPTVPPRASETGAKPPAQPLLSLEPSWSDSSDDEEDDKAS